ncbi:sulfatase [bacterium]|nr:sulfatase [candidate division CSSED10-310 bacterium]
MSENVTLSNNISATNPNIVLISIDTLRADYLGCYGYSRAYTPNIDRLSNQGILMHRTICSIPHTTPSHASILTGLYPKHHGSRDNAYPIQPDIMTLPEYLADYGYASAGFASHFLLSPKCSRLNKGFDHYDVPLRPNYMTFTDQNGNSAIISNKFVPAPEIVAKVRQWLPESRQPFFLFIHFYDCHRPHRTQPPFKLMDLPGSYGREVALVDQAVGHILSALEESTTLPTYVHLVADHGESLGEHNYRGHGTHLYFPSLEVPWIIGGLKTQLPKSITTNLAKTIDITPTILHMADANANTSFDGENILDAASSKTQYAMSESASCYSSETGKRIRSVRNDHYTLIYGPASGIRELYDETNDPAELKNLFNMKHEIVTDLLAALEVWHSDDPGVDNKPENELEPEILTELRSLGYVLESSD